MNILIVGPTYPHRSGISHYNTLLFRELKAHHNTSLYSFSRQYPQFFFPGTSDTDTVSRFKIKESGAQYVIDSLNPVTWFSALGKMKKEKPDLIIAHWWTAFWGPLYCTLLPALRGLTGAKILLICHNVKEHEDSRLKRFIAKRVFSLADFYIVHSEKGRDDLNAMLPGCNVRKAAHPAYDIFDQNKIARDEARKKLGLLGNTALFFGIVREYKGLEYLLAAVPHVLKKTGLTLVVAGEFWQNKDRYISMIKKLGIRDNVRLIDNFIPNEEVETYFKASDVAVLPYTNGTGSGIAQIALAFKLPIIATDIGSLSEIIENGKTGYLVKPRDPEELAEKITEYFVTGKRASFAQNIAQKSGQYSWSKLRETIESFA